MSKKRKKTKKNKVPARIHHRPGWKLYPSFTYPQKKSEIAHIPTKFIDLVKDAVRSFDFTNNNICDELEQTFFKFIKRDGIHDALQNAFNNKSHRTTWALHIIKRIGQYIYDYIETKSPHASYFPYYYVGVAFDNHNVIIIFEGLLSRSTPYGKMYYSITPPKGTINNAEYKISFSRHAIERICERLVMPNYLGYGEAFNFLTNHIQFETCTLPNGKIAISLFEKCAPQFFSKSYAKNAIGEKVKYIGEYYYRLGYCPIGFFDGYAKAITLLTPGMKGTPEYELLTQANMTSKKRQQLNNSIQNSLSFEKLAKTEDFTAIKWFHDNGIPQVVKEEEI